MPATSSSHGRIRGMVQLPKMVPMASIRVATFPAAARRRGRAGARRGPRRQDRLPASRSDRPRSATRGTVRPAGSRHQAGWTSPPPSPPGHCWRAGPGCPAPAGHPENPRRPLDPDRPGTSRTRMLRMSGRCRQRSTRPAKAADAGSPSVTMATTAGIPSCGARLTHRRRPSDPRPRHQTRSRRARHGPRFPPVSGKVYLSGRLS